MQLRRDVLHLFLCFTNQDTRLQQLPESSKVRTHTELEEKLGGRIGIPHYELCAADGLRMSVGCSFTILRVGIDASTSVNIRKLLWVKRRENRGTIFLINGYKSIILVLESTQLLESPYLPSYPIHFAPSSSSVAMPSSSMILRPNIANMNAEGTPPNSPTEPAYEPTVFLQVTQELVDKLQLLVPTKNVVEGSSKVEITQVPASKDPNLEEARPRASRVEYKSINEVYVILSDRLTMLTAMTSQLGQEGFQLHDCGASGIDKR